MNENDVDFAQKKPFLLFLAVDIAFTAGLSQMILSFLECR